MGGVGNVGGPGQAGGPQGTEESSGSGSVTNYAPPSP